MPTDNSAYRLNVQNSEPKKVNTGWKYGDAGTPSTRDVYKRIGDIQSGDQQRAAEMAYDFYRLQNTKGSPYYNAYGQATNQAVSNLAKVGIDASVLTTDWFKQNTDWQKHLVYSSTTNSPVSPVKKATAQQYAAYQMYQISKALDTTNKVDSEWAAMQQEIYYWTQRTDLNLSDDDIIAKINSEKQKKYPTLFALDKSKEPGQNLMELNHGINYSEDNMYGVIWAARNGKSTGDTFMNNMMSATGKGTVWQKNDDIASRMDRSNPETYSPFSVGMTADDVGAYFNVTGIDDKMLAEIEKTIDWNNETDVKMYNKAYDALQTTKKAEQELSDLQKKINDWIIQGRSEDKMLKDLDTLLSGSNYSTLKKMDESIQRRDSRDDMVQTSYAVNYRKQDVVNYIKDTYRRLSTLKNANSIAYAGIVGGESVKTKESVEAEATQLWHSEKKNTYENTDIGIREARKEIEKKSAEAITNTAVSPEAEIPADQNKPTFEELEAVYDKEHGKGAYRRDIIRANGMTSQISAMDAGDAKVRDTASTFSDDMNPAETSVFKGYSGSQDLAQNILKEKRNEWIAKGVPEKVAQRQTKASNVGYIQSVMGYYPGIKKYEEASKNVKDLEASIAEKQEALGAKMYVGQTNSLSFETEIDGSKYRVTMSPDLGNVQSIENIDREDFPAPIYPNFGIYDNKEDYDFDTRIWDAVLSDEKKLNEFRENYLTTQEHIDAAKGLELTPEDEELRSSIRKDEVALEDARKYVSENQADYEKSKAEMAREQQRRDAHIRNMEALGQDTTAIKIADIVLDSLYSFNDYDATIWEEYNPTYAYSQAIDFGMDKDAVLGLAKKEHEEIAEQIKDIEFLQKYVDDNGIKLDGSVQSNIDRRLAKLNRDLKDAEYFEMQFASDFEEVAATGKANEDAQVKANTMTMTEDPLDFEGSITYEFGDNQFYLTPDEKKTFYYLSEKDKMNGTKMARDYADLLNDPTYGVLNVRRAKATEQASEELTEKSFIGANIYAIALSPYTAVASLATNIDKALTGRELNPYDTRLNTMRFRSSVRSASAESILNTFGEKNEDGTVKETTMSKLAQGFYEIVTNRADSMINATAFGWMFGGVGNEMLKEFLSASPMGISAATEAAMRAKEKGASDEQAYGVAAATFLAETATEAISLENIAGARGLAEASSGHAVKDFLKNWLTKAGISEMVGESLNDIIENTADRLIMGELSEHAEKVKAYREAGYSEEEAEQMTTKDEVAGVLRTALISYLSPGLDAFQTAGARVRMYAGETYARQSQGENVSLRQVRRDVINRERAEAARGPQEGPVANPQQTQTEEQTEQAVQTAPAEQAETTERTPSKAELRAEEQAPKAPKMTKAEQFTTDFEILETANGGDRSAQNSAVSAVLDDGSSQEATDIANATATNLSDLMQDGKSISEETQDLLIGANVADIDTDVIKQGIEFASLGGDESACRQVMQSDAYQTATPDQKATMLAEAVQADAQNEAVAEAVQQNTHEYRVAREEAKLIEQGAGNAIIDAETDAEVASMETQKAQDALDTQKDVEEAARKAVTRISADELQRDPANDSITNDLRQALDKLQKQASVTQEYQQSLKNAQDREEAAKQKAKDVKQETLKNIREQAEQTVQQEDFKRGQEKQEQLAARKLFEQQQAEQETINNETESSTAMDAEDFLQKYHPDATEEEKQKVREMFARATQEMPAQKGPILDENGNMTLESLQRRDRFVKQVSKKFGINIDVADTTRGGIVDRQNGYYDRRNNRIVIDQNASVNDAMYFVIGHELTHVAEQSETYGALARSLLRARYGFDDAQLASDIRARKAMYDDRLARMHEQDNTIDATPLTEEEASQEIVADLMGDLLKGDQTLVDRLVADEPSTARRILESIKNFLKKAVGMKGEWKTNAQTAVDMLERALKDVQTKQNGTETKYSLGEAQPIAENDNGVELAYELPGGTVGINDIKYSFNSLTPSEQDKIRNALYNAKDENGNNRFTKEQVDYYVNDMIGIAAMIGMDPERLDFDVTDPEKSMVKSNADYGASIDASTLCAKRLLYQGTFDEIQHLLPNTPLMPEDLIELANMMREMGYETPCGICYVESRRRNLGKEAQNWLDGYNGEYIPRIEEVTTSDGLESLRTGTKEQHQAYEDFMEAMKNLNQRNPKVVQLRTEYRGEIRDMTDNAVQKAINHGGLRLQSFSDFETPHLLDMIQVVMDMASKNLSSQAYTKVPNFAWAFGDTGIKINLSEIGKGTGIVIDNGLSFSDLASMPYEEAIQHIKLEYDDVEGMPHKEAMNLRNRYSKNVGTILVGMNDEHIIAAMGDNEVDFIIPFHRSGWTNSELAKMPVLESYTDYQNDQNEKKIKGRKKNGKGYETYAAKDSKIKNFEPVGEKTANGKGQNGYWDFTKSGMENAEVYLKMCADDGRVPKFSQFLVDNGDGSFSLPQGDDYRSTAIREGYWKTLIDFKMYDNEGVGSPQTAVTPNVNMDEARRILNEYTLDRNGISRKSNNELPVAQPVVDRYVAEYKAKHPLDETRTKYSLPEDSLYMSAVDHGEVDVAQEEIDRVAEQAGYTDKAYHGTERFGFTQFDMDKGNGAVFVSFNPELAGTYTQDGARNIRENEGRVEYDPSNPEELIRIVKEEKTKYQADKNKGWWRIRNIEQDGNGNFMISTMAGDYTVSGQELANIISDDRTAERLGLGGVYQLYTKPGNQLVIDAYGNEHNNIPVEWSNKNETTNTIAQYAKEHGYDSVRINNVYDPGGYAQNDSENYGDIGIFFNQDDVKSADIVTYDDNGNVIPPSERFQTNNPDIRYSLPSDSLLEQQIRQYIRNGGSIPNQNPNTAPAPRFNQPTEKETGYRKWGNDLAQQSDELFQKTKDTVLNSEYTKDTNAAELNRALDWIQGNRSKYDPDGYVTSFMKLTGNPNTYRTKDGQAKMVAMMALAVAKDDVNGQVDLADLYNKQGTSLGQALQARKLFKLMTPEGRIATLRKMLSDQQQVLDGRGVNVELKLSDAVYQAAAFATKDGEFDKVRNAAYEELAKQIPATWKDRLRSWRMLSMLANPRTHIRNIVGNALFIPAVAIKNKIGAVVEQATGAERTKTTAILLDKDIRDFARQDAEKIKDTLTGEAKFNEASQIAKSQKKLGKALDWLADWNSKFLEGEDWIFLKGHYRRALGGWMQANGYTAEQMNANPELLEKGRAYAIEEAQKATYRDFNKTASTLNDISRKGGIPGFIVEAALPFKKTPANILKRGIEYSPVGLVKSLTSDMIHMKQYLDAVKNDKTIPDKALSPTQVIDHICAGLSGSMITALGFMLAGAGVVTCGLDDDDDKLEALKGGQEYSIHLNLFGEDVTYTLDWAAPVSMPFFVGAAIRDQMEREGGANINEVANAIGNIAEPVFNLSMLDGVNSLFKTSQYDDTNAITQILAKIVTNYGTSYVPSALGATTRTFFDDTRRKSFVTSGENTGIEGTLRYAWEQIENKIPGLSTSNIPYRDVWGNAETSGLAERIFENFISPGYANNYKEDLVVNELSRLYEATGDAAMIPEEAKKSITYKNTKYNLSPEDYDKLVVTRGQAAYNGLSQLMNSDAYKRASAEEQKEQVKKVWSYADQLGKAAVIPDYKITAATSVDEAATSGTVAYYQDAMITSLDSGDYTAYDTCIQALHDSGYEDSKIKTKISNTYREKYKDAYRKKDYVTMLDIEDMLDRTGYVFDYEKWQDAVDGEV